MASGMCAYILLYDSRSPFAAPRSVGLHEYLSVSSILADKVSAVGSVGDSITLLYAAGIPLTPFAWVTLLPESLLLAGVANCLLVLLRRLALPKKAAGFVAA